MRTASPWHSAAILALSIGLVLRPFAVQADDSDVQRVVSAAVALYEELEYERALQKLAQARTLAKTREDQVAVSLLEGIVLADLGRPDDSSAAFQAALAQDPDAELPVAVSPKVVREFESLREQARQARAAQPEPEPAYLPNKALAEPAKSPPSVVPWVLGGVALAVAGTGGVFGIQSSQHLGDARRAEFQDQTIGSLERAEGSARVANVLFAVAGTAAVSAVVSWFVTAPPAENE